MIHHVSFGTNDLMRARAFYKPVMDVLGLRFIREDEDEALHFGVGEITFSLIKPVNHAPASAGNGVHVAFQALNRETVDEFYRLALLHGGSSDGKPGTRPDYDDHYYAAFVFDPDGNKLEAVTMAAK